MPDFEALLARTSDGLKSAGFRVKVQKRGRGLSLYAKLPPAPGCTKAEPCWQRIALPFDATPAGLKEARSRAAQLQEQLDRHEFSWHDWREVKEPASPTAGEWIDRFKNQYFSRNNPTRQSLNTWTSDYQKAFRRLNRAAVITPELLREVVLSTKPDTRQRKRFAEKLNALARFAGVDVDLRSLRGKYSIHSIKPREIPTLQQVEQWLLSIDDPSDRQLAAMQTTYALRPHELWYLDTHELVDGGVMVHVQTGTKTGAHSVLPSPERWVKMFDLANYRAPERRKEDLCNSTISGLASEIYKRHGCPWVPYTFRHFGAIQRIFEGWSLSLIALQLGDEETTVSRYYHRWVNRGHLLQERERLRRERVETEENLS